MLLAKPVQLVCATLRLWLVGSIAVRCLIGCHLDVDFDAGCELRNSLRFLGLRRITASARQHENSEVAALMIQGFG